MIIAAPISASFRQQLTNDFFRLEPNGTPPEWVEGGAFFFQCEDPPASVSRQAFAEATIRQSGHDPDDGYRILDVMPQFDRELFCALDFDAALGVRLSPLRSKRIFASQMRHAKLAAAIEAGFTQSEQTYSITSRSLANWQKLATTLRAEIAEGETAATDSVAIFRADGALVELPASGVLSLLAKIGKAARLLQTRDLKWRSEIAAATTEAELDAIIVAIEGA